MRMSDERRTKLEKRFDRLESNFLETVERIKDLEKKERAHTKLYEIQQKEMSELTIEFAEYKLTHSHKVHEELVQNQKILERQNNQMKSVLTKLLKNVYMDNRFTDWANELLDELSGETDEQPDLPEFYKDPFVKISREDWEDIMEWVEWGLHWAGDGRNYDKWHKINEKVEK